MMTTGIVAALAAAGGPPAPPQGDPFSSIFLIVGMIAIFWLLIIRPQQKRMKEHRAMVEGAKRGDTVVTGGGLIGKVTRVKDDDNEVEVEIADGIKVRVVKSTLTDVRAKGEPAKAPKDDKK